MLVAFSTLVSMSSVLMLFFQPAIPDLVTIAMIVLYKISHCAARRSISRRPASFNTVTCPFSVLWICLSASTRSCNCLKIPTVAFISAFKLTSLSGEKRFAVRVVSNVVASLDPKLTMLASELGMFCTSAISQLRTRCSKTGEKRGKTFIIPNLRWGKKFKVQHQACSLLSPDLRTS